MIRGILEWRPRNVNVGVDDYEYRENLEYLLGLKNCQFEKN